jgi:hypothetical protein
MKNVAAVVSCLLLVTRLAVAQQPATAPANLLVGRWQLLSNGARKLPPDIHIFWTFDDHNVVVTVGNGDTATTSQYSLRNDGVHDIISLCDDGKQKPNRVGWYELKDGKLRMHLTLGTGKPPERWDEDEVMLFEPAPAVRR